MIGRAALVMFFGMALACVLLHKPGHAQSYSQNAGNIVLVLDASRSMWGQIDGTNKIVSLKNVLKQSLKSYDKRTNLGVVAYGHSKESGCQDVDLVTPLGLLRSDSYSKDIDQIRPKGSTPIANALKMAARETGPEHLKSSIILVSDGLDNCQGDPCATVRSLKEERPGLAVHVIAFDRKSKDQLKALSCMADASGGQFTSATSEKELRVALDNAFDVSIAQHKASLGQLLEVTGSVEKAIPWSRSSSDQVITTNVITPTAANWESSTFSASQTSDPLASDPLASTSPARVARGHGSNVVAQLDQPGGGFDTQTTVAPLSGGKTPLTVVGVLNEGGSQISTGIIWRVFETKPDNAGQYRLLSTYREPVPTFLLAPGEYLINAAYGRAHLTRKIVVNSGVAMTEQFVINAGGLRLGATLPSGEVIPANDVTYDISSEEQDQFGNRDKILSNAKPGLIYRLNAGIYRITSRYGNANAVVEADVTVEPGKLTEAQINHQAARVTFKLVLQPGGDAMANTQWQIATKAGVVVKQSAGALPSHILAAGDYVVVAQHSGRSYQKPFVVKSGEVKQVEVVVQ